MHIYYSSRTKEQVSRYSEMRFQQSLLVLSLGFAATSNETVVCNVGWNLEVQGPEAHVRFANRFEQTLVVEPLRLCVIDPLM